MEDIGYVDSFYSAVELMEPDGQAVYQELTKVNCVE